MRDAAFEDRLKYMGPARQAIITTKKRKGVIDCPRCGRAKALVFVLNEHRGTHHIHASCMTPDCLRWME